MIVRNIVLLGFLTLFPFFSLAVYPSGRADWTSTVSHKYSSDELKESRVRVSSTHDTWFLGVYQNRSELIRFNNNGNQTPVVKSEPVLNAKLSSVSSDGSVWYATQSSDSKVTVTKMNNGNNVIGSTWTLHGPIKSFSVETIGGDAVIAVATVGSLRATSTNNANITFNPTARSTDSYAYFLRLQSDGTVATGSWNKGSCSNWIIGDIAVVSNDKGGNNVIVEGSVGFCTNAAGWQGALFTLRMINAVWLASFSEGNATSATAFLPFFSSTLLIEATAPQPTTMQLRSFVGNRFLAYISMKEKYGFNVYAFFDTRLFNVGFGYQVGEQTTSFSTVRFGYSEGDDSTYTFASDLTKGWLLSLRTASGKLGGSIDDIFLISGNTSFVNMELVTRNETASSGVVGGSFEGGSLSVFNAPVNGDSGTFVAGFSVQLNFCPDVQPIQCQDQRCVIDESLCFSSCNQTVCSDGTCRDSCPQDDVCPTGKFLCPNGLCAPNGDSCQGTCNNGEIQCFDGSCTSSNTCNGVPFNSPTLGYEATVPLDSNIDLSFKSAYNISDVLGGIKIEAKTFNTTLSEVNSVVLNLTGAEISQFKDLTNVDGSYVGVHSFLSSVLSVKYPKGFGTAFEEGSSVVLSFLVTLPQNIENATFCLAKQVNAKNWTCVDKDMYLSPKRDIAGDIYSGIVSDPQGTWGVLLLGGSAPDESSYTGIQGTDSTDTQSDGDNASKTTNFFKIGVGIAVGIAVFIIIISVIAAFVLLKRKRTNNASKLSNSLY